MVYVSLLSGIDFVAAALAQLVGPRFQFALAADANRTVANALHAAWGHRIGLLTGYALGVETEDGLNALRGSVDIMMISIRCAPWSRANALSTRSTARKRQVDRALEENQALLLLAASALPRAILLECVDGGVQQGLRRQWHTLQGLILRLEEWEWSCQRICPRDTLQGYVPRMRIWFVGIRKQEF